MNPVSQSIIPLVKFEFLRYEQDYREVYEETSSISQCETLDQTHYRISLQADPGNIAAGSVPVDGSFWALALAGQSLGL